MSLFNLSLAAFLKEAAEKQVSSCMSEDLFGLKVPQRDPFFIVIKPFSSSRKNDAGRPDVWDMEVQRDPAQHLQRIQGPLWSTY